MFKFVTKGDPEFFKAAVFYNGQKLMEFFIEKEEDSFSTFVYDGNDNFIESWYDYEESD